MSKSHVEIRTDTHGTRTLVNAARDPREHARAQSTGAAVERAARDVHSTQHAHGTSLTFAIGEVVGTGHTHVTAQPRHSGSAAALPAVGVAGCVQGAFGGAVAGWGRGEESGV